MNLSKLKTALELFLLSDDPKMPMPLITSAPGLGKSSVIAQVAEQHGYDLIVWRLGQMDASEVGGIPDINRETGRMRYMLPDVLPVEGCKPTIVFLDEIADAERMVYNSAAEFILEGTLRGAHTYRMPRNCRRVAASNRLVDRAGARELPSHIRNRVVFLPAEADVDVWVRDFAMKKGIREEVISFLRHRPNLLHSFDPKQESFPTPRSWEFVSQMMPGLIKHPDLAMELIQGAVGEAAAIEFTGFLRLITQVPDPDMVFTNPMGVPLPTGTSAPAILYALCVAIAARVTQKVADNMFIFLSRIPADFALTCVKDALSREPRILHCKEGMKWTSKNAPMLA